MGVQLRHYPIKPGELDNFLESFRPILEVRETFGFRCLFVLADRATNEFIIAIEGDFERAEAEYSQSAALAEAEVATGAPKLLAGPPRIANVDVVRSLWS
jgi:hypothetical protein